MLFTSPRLSIMRGSAPGCGLVTGESEMENQLELRFAVIAGAVLVAAGGFVTYYLWYVG